MPFKGHLGPPSPGDAAAASNAETVLRMVTGHWTAQIVRAAAELRLADDLAAGARTAEEIAGLEGSDGDTTYRLMRACAALGLLTRETGRRFSLTPLGQLLRADVAGSLRPAALVQGAAGHWGRWMLLPEAVREGCNGTQLAVGVGLSDYFHHAPRATSAPHSEAPVGPPDQLIDDVIALLDLGDAQTVADIGAGDGALILALLEDRPRIDGLLLGSARAVADATDSASSRGLSNRLQAVTGDYFEAVPKADYYLLARILHDWSDARCRVILGNIREAAETGTRLLVIEAVVGLAQAPDPAALLDMNALAASEGREREPYEFDVLFGASGWRRTGIRRTRSISWLIELEAV